MWEWLFVTVLAGVATQRSELINMAVVSFLVETGRWEDVYEQPQKQETAIMWSPLEQGWTPITVKPLFYDHPQNQIGVVVKEGWSSTRGLTIL